MALTDEDIKKRADYSRMLARKYEHFIVEFEKRGHSNTVAHALMLNKSVLHNALGRDTFSAEEFMLEIDKILIENNIVGYWFWRDIL